MIRIAAVGDVHYDSQSNQQMRQHIRGLQGKADLLLLAGDLTKSGEMGEARALAADLKESPVPVVLVLGNHDYHQRGELQIVRMFRDEGFTALEGETARFEIRNQAIGVIGLKGFGGGFIGASASEFGELEMKSFAHMARAQAEILNREMASLDGLDFRFVLLHFSPIEATLLGERRELFPFLGNYQLAEAIDLHGADCVFHGHAHLGTEKGVTPRGIPVRNVAQPVIRHAYNIYQFEKPRAAREQAPGLSPSISGSDHDTHRL